MRGERVEQVAVPVRRTDIFSAYFGSDPRPLISDVAGRPDHYTEEQRDQVMRLERGQALEPRERAELVMQFLRPSRLAAETKRIMTRVTSKKPNEGEEETEADSWPDASSTRAAPRRRDLAWGTEQDARAGKTFDWEDWDDMNPVPTVENGGFKKPIKPR